MTTIYYERDGDVGAIAGERVAVVGYGNQGRSWALNLRDSGCEPVICVRRDATREQAVADGFEAHDVEAASDTDIICILVPDDVVALLPIEPRSDSCVIVASGYTLAFNRLEPPGDWKSWSILVGSCLIGLENWLTMIL
jgi:ketol-acid reductoisomerase